MVVSDNLRSGITKACFYEPAVNRSYAEMAAHYNTAIVPARPYRARDELNRNLGDDEEGGVSRRVSSLPEPPRKEMLWGRRRGCGTFGAFRANRRGAPCRSRMTPTNPFPLLSKIPR